jgi:ubiquinone/menaquinone biosynthesis C-methylase UbiE
MHKSPYSDPAMASVYESVAARLQFAAPGRDLVEIVGVTEGDRVLDVGTGTGVVAAAGRTMAGQTGFIVGSDAAVEMLRLARKETANLVVARVPELPFADETFDAVIAGFVVSHFERYVDGLTDMIRICRNGGRVGMSAWGSLPNPAATLWADIAGQYAPREQLTEAFLKHIPWDTWFSRIENVAEALETAGLSSVVTETRCYSVRMPTHEYLLSREASVQGLVLREALSSVQWHDFTTKVADAFQDKFGEIVEYERDAHFGVGTKSSTSARYIGS